MYKLNIFLIAALQLLVLLAGVTTAGSKDVLLSRSQCPAGEKFRCYCKPKPKKRPSEEFADYTCWGGSQYAPACTNGGLLSCQPGNRVECKSSASSSPKSKDTTTSQPACVTPANPTTCPPRRGTCPPDRAMACLGRDKVTCDSSGCKCSASGTFCIVPPSCDNSPRATPTCINKPGRKAICSQEGTPQCQNGRAICEDKSWPLCIIPPTCCGGDKNTIACDPDIYSPVCTGNGKFHCEGSNLTCTDPTPGPRGVKHKWNPMCFKTPSCIGKKPTCTDSYRVQACTIGTQGVEDPHCRGVGENNRAQCQNDAWALCIGPPSDLDISVSCPNSAEETVHCDCPGGDNKPKCVYSSDGEMTFDCGGGGGSPRCRHEMAPTCQLLVPLKNATRGHRGG